MKSYRVNEVFYSLQGEGGRAGTPNVFVRFAGCNLQCRSDNEAGFDCDTEFTSGRSMSLAQLLEEVDVARCEGNGRTGVILTGGEPALQLDPQLLAGLHSEGFAPVCIETNGTVDLSGLALDYIACSPKSAEHTLRLKAADELRYVRRAGMGLPRPVIVGRDGAAPLLYLSPAFEADATLARANLSWCIKLIKENPSWRLSVQQHKWWGVR